MNIIQKIEYYKKMYEELNTLPDAVDMYLSSYDVEGKSVDDMMKEFFRAFGKYSISNQDFIYIAKSLGYKHRQICVEGVRFYTLMKE